MDPMMFGINSDVAAEAIGAIVFLSFAIERALAVPFEWQPVIKKIDGKDFKEPIAAVVSLFVVWYLEFDALAVIFSKESSGVIGYVITA